VSIKYENYNVLFNKLHLEDGPMVYRFVIWTNVFWIKHSKVFSTSRPTDK